MVIAPHISDKQIKSFKNLEEASSSILKLMGQYIGMNTLFIARNDTFTNEILKSINKDEVLITEGDTLPFEETFCKLSVEHGKDTLIISDITKNDRTKDLDVTTKLGGGSFIGIPIYYDNLEVYGTICGLDPLPLQFSEEDIEMFETMASLLSYVIELESAQNQINKLSAPFVPLTSGAAILPIIGDVNEDRVDVIIQLTLSKCQELDLDYLVIDLSGILQINAFVSKNLLKIVNILQLIGVTPLLIGIRPDLAMKAAEIKAELREVIFKPNLESALKEIGLSINSM